MSEFTHVMITGLSISGDQSVARPLRPQCHHDQEVYRGPHRQTIPGTHTQLRRRVQLRGVTAGTGTRGGGGSGGYIVDYCHHRAFSGGIVAVHFDWIDRFNVIRLYSLRSLCVHGDYSGHIMIIIGTL